MKRVGLALWVCQKHLVGASIFVYAYISAMLDETAAAKANHGYLSKGQERS